MIRWHRSGTTPRAPSRGSVRLDPVSADCLRRRRRHHGSSEDISWSTPSTTAPTDTATPTSQPTSSTSGSRRSAAFASPGCGRSPRNRGRRAIGAGEQCPQGHASGPFRRVRWIRRNAGLGPRRPRCRTPVRRSGHRRGKHSTTLVLPGHVVAVDRYGNLQVSPASGLNCRSPEFAG